MKVIEKFLWFFLGAVTAVAFLYSCMVVPSIVEKHKERKEKKAEAAAEESVEPV